MKRLYNVEIVYNFLRCVLKLRSLERSGTTSSHSEQSRETLQR